MKRLLLPGLVGAAALVQLAGGAGAAGVSGSWSAAAPLPEARYGLAATAAAGRIYALGGSDVDGNVLKTNEAYSPTTNAWSHLAPLPVERMRPTVLTGPDGKVWVVGGRNDSSFPIDAVSVYDPGTGTWSTPTSVPTHRGDPAAAFGGDGRLYVIGGCCDTNGALSVVEAYDPATDSWSTAPPIPLALFRAHALEGLNGRIYVIGGATPAGFLSTVQIFDPTTKTWSQGASTPLVGGGDQMAATVGADGLMYFVGGFDSLARPSSAAFVYDPGTDSWGGAGGCPPMTARADLAAASLGGRVYAIGGDSNLNVLRTVEAFAPSASGGGSISVTPAQIGQGGVRNGVITGSGFRSGAVVSFCPGGVSAVNTTVPSGSKIKTTFRADADATPGPRNVIVTFADGSSDTCAGCVTVDPGPKPTATSPAGLPMGAHADVNVFGTGFQTGAIVRFNCAVPLPGCASGVTVNSTTFVGSTHLVANVNVAVGALAGSRTVVVSNPDAGRGSCGGCLSVLNTARLAFMRAQNQSSDVYRVNPDGTGIAQLTNDPVAAYLSSGASRSPWSPDGKRIAFAKATGLNREEIWVMNADGSAQAKIVGGIDFAVGWPPVWSPDGAQLAFTCGGDICVVNVDGSGFLNLTAGIPNRGGSADPVWSPDGSRLAFVQLMTPGFHDRGDVLAVDADGSGLVDVTKLAAPCDASDPAWSPDGTKLAFDADCQDGFSDIWTIGADGSGRRQLTSQEATGEPAWSPDAKKLAYVSDRAGNADVWTMNADGSAKTRLTTAAGDDADPVWSPDGSSIAYVGERWSLCGARGPNKEIIVMNARGGAQRDVSNSCADDVSPSWQP